MHEARAPVTVPQYQINNRQLKTGTKHVKWELWFLWSGINAESVHHMLPLLPSVSFFPDFPLCISCLDRFMNCVKSLALCVVTKSSLMHGPRSNHTPFWWMPEMVPHTPAGPPSTPLGIADAGCTSGSSPQVPTMLCVSCRLYENKGEADFVESLLQLFRSINDMMSSLSELTVRVKVGATMISQA